MLIEAAVHFPTVVFTIGLGIALVYWVFVLLGALDLDIGADAENVLNTNYATAYDNTYQYSAGNATRGGTWNNPTTIFTPRFVRLNFTVSF